MKKKTDWDWGYSSEKTEEFLLDLEKKNEKSTKNNILNNLYIIFKILVIILITILFGYIEWNYRS